MPRGFRNVTLTPAETAHACDLLAEGWSCGEVALHLGCPLVTVAEVAYRHGIAPVWHDPAPELDGGAPGEEPWQARARHLAAQGLWLSEVARRVGVSRGVVTRWAERAGVTFGPPPDPTPPVLAMTPEREAQARALAPTHSIPEAAAAMGVRKETLRRWAARRPDVLFASGYHSASFRARAARLHLARARATA